MNRRRLRPAAWLALLAFALQLAAMAGGTAYAARGVAGTGIGQQICTTGNRTGAAPSDGAPLPGSGHFQHCPFCATACAAALPPAPGAAGFPLSARPSCLLPPAADAPLPDMAVPRRMPARGPPALS